MALILSKRFQRLLHRHIEINIVVGVKIRIKQMLLSVVIPVYNVELYLDRCIRSIEGQSISYNEFEIICVNDGSTDMSEQLIKSLQGEYRNLVLISQVNQGVSVARNEGLKVARGNFILFIDPDDYLENNSLSRILGTAVKTKAQLTIPGYILCNPLNGNKTSKSYGSRSGLLTKGIEAFKLLRTNSPFLADSAVGILYDVEFLRENNLLFVPGVVYNEDCEFLARVHCLATRCLILDHPLYNVVIRPGSASRSNLFALQKARDGFLLAVDNLQKFRASRSLSTNQQLFLNQPIVQFVFLAVYSGIKTKSFTVFNRVVLSLHQYGLSYLELNGCSGYLLKFGHFYNCSPKIGSLVFVVFLGCQNYFQRLLKKIFKYKKWLNSNIL